MRLASKLKIFDSRIAIEYGEYRPRPTGLPEKLKSFIFIAGYSNTCKGAKYRKKYDEIIVESS